MYDDRHATPDDACREFAANCGSKKAWISTPYDTWIENPNYKGAPVPHPDFEEEGE